MSCQLFSFIHDEDDAVTTYYNPTVNQAVTTSPYTLPTSRKAAQQAPDAFEWALSWNKELDALDTRDQRHTAIHSP